MDKKTDTHPIIGKVLADDYQIISFLGKGGMGSVFSALQLSLKRKVAIKLLSSSNFNLEELKRFKQEIAAMALLSHPHIVTILHRGKYGEPPNLFYVMELLEGGSLRNYLQMYGKLSSLQTIRLIHPVAEALAFAHNNGCIHRDIKPDNLLFTKDYKSLKIADFGIAKIASYDMNITKSQEMVGTILYAAPEQLKWYEQDKEADSIPVVVDTRADQYSLGLVLYQMVSGTLPFKAKNLMTILKAFSKPYTPLSSVVKNVPKSLEWLISTMISRDPDKRFPNDEILLEAFESVELEISSSSSTRVFAVSKTEEMINVTPPNLPIVRDYPSHSEKLRLQNLKTISCETTPQDTPVLKYILFIFSVTIVATVLLFSIFFVVFKGRNTKNNIKVTTNSDKTYLNFNLHFDINPPENYQKPKILLLSKKGNIEWNSNKKILTGDYILSCTLDGYKCVENNKKINIKLDDKNFSQMDINFEANVRKISKNILNKKNEIIKPRIYRIDGKEVGEETYFKPGNHSIYLELDRYKNINRKFFLPPGKADFLYKVDFSKAENKVEVKISCKYDPIPPENYDNPKVLFVSDTKSIKWRKGIKIPPGKYSLSFILKAYYCLEQGKTIEINAGTPSLEIKANFKANPRKVASKIINAATGKKITPLVYKINGQKIGNRFYIKPGKYKILLQFKNYEEINKEIFLPPDEQDFYYKAILQPLKEIVFTLGSYSEKPNGGLYPLKCYANSKEIISNHIIYKLSKNKLKVSMKVSENVENVIIYCGFYYLKALTKNLFLIEDFNCIDGELLVTHLKLLSDKALKNQLKTLYNKDKEKLSRMPKKEKDALYNFLLTYTKKIDLEDMENYFWQIRFLTKDKEYKEYIEYKKILQELEYSKHEVKIDILQNFLRKYPKGILRKEVLNLINYSKITEEYENRFKTSVRDFYLSTSEKRILKKTEIKLKKEDIEKIYEKVRKYLKKLNCEQTLEEMMRD